jgi:hypothetical protein
MNMKKVRFQGMGMHFSIPRMNERSCKRKSKNYDWRTACEKTPGFLEAKECVRLQFIEFNPYNNAIMEFFIEP